MKTNEKYDAPNNDGALRYETPKCSMLKYIK